MPDSEDYVEVTNSVEDHGPQVEVVGEDAPEPDTETPEEELPLAAEAEAEEKVEDLPGDSADSDSVEYEPNFTYRANQEEKQFPDWIKEAVKSKEVEDQLREVFQKADGLDPIKERYETRTKEYENLNTEYEQLKTGVNALKHYADTDPLTFVEKIGWTPQHVLNLAKEILQYNEASPEERQRIDQSRANAHTAFQTQQQLSLLQQQNEQMQQQQLNYMFDSALASPNVSTVAQAYDQKVGRIGAFRDRATREWNANTSHQSPQDAVKAVVDELTLFGLNQTQQQPVQPQVQAEPPPPSLPNVGQGRATASPTKKVFKDLNSLRKHVEDVLAHG